MAQFDPGAYKVDHLRVFDGGEDNESDDEGSRLPLLIAIALIVFLAFGGVVWLAYNQGVRHGREVAPRTAAQAPANSPRSGSVPENPYKGLKIYQPPTTSYDESSNDNAAPDSAAESEGADENAAHADAPGRAAPAATSPAKTATAAQSHAGEERALRQPAPAQARPAPVAPIPKTAAPARALPEHEAALPSGSKTSATVSPETTASQAPGAAPAAAFVLQIGAFKSEAEAMDSWRAYKAAHAPASAYEPDVRKVELPGKGTWYRVRIGSFASMNEANALCKTLKASGGNCFPAKR